MKKNVLVSDVCRRGTVQRHHAQAGGSPAHPGLDRPDAKFSDITRCVPRGLKENSKRPNKKTAFYKSTMFLSRFVLVKNILQAFKIFKEDLKEV